MDLITVLEAIVTGRQTRLEITLFVWRDVAVPEIVQWCLELPMHFPVFFPANYF